MTRLVIDACVIASAGTGSGVREPSPAAVSVLDAVRERGRHHGDLRLAMNVALETEWIACRGPYGLAWLQDMMSRRLVDQVELTWQFENDLLEAASNNHRAPIEHDLHVVRLAMVTDRRLVSLETRLPKYLRATLKRSGCPPEIATLHVVSPLDKKISGWIGLGAPEDATLQLGETQS